MQKNDTYEFRTYTATIIESNTWSETHVSGNDYSSSAIRSHSRRRQTVWLRDDLDGTEFETEITQAKLSCRVGHRLLFVHGRSLRKNADKYEKLLAIRNLNTGQTHMDLGGHGSVISDAVPFSFRNLLLFIFFSYVSILDVVEPNNGLIFTVTLMAYFAASFFRRRQPRLLFDRLLAEILEESGKKQTSMETVTVTALAG